MALPLKYNLRNIIVRKGSTLATAFTIGLTVAVFLMVMALARGIDPGRSRRSGGVINEDGWRASLRDTLDAAGHLFHQTRRQLEREHHTITGVPGQSRGSKDFGAADRS